MEIVINTSAAMDAEIGKLAALEGKNPEALGRERATQNLLNNLREGVRAARKAALMRVMAPEQAARAAYTPIDWAAADRPAYLPINWTEK